MTRALLFGILENVRGNDEFRDQHSSIVHHGCESVKEVVLWTGKIRLSLFGLGCLLTTLIEWRWRLYPPVQEARFPLLRLGW